MQKKIVAAICAAALALAVPAAAFAVQSNQASFVAGPKKSMVVITADSMGTIEGKNATLSNITAEGDADYVKSLSVAATDDNGYYVTGSNVISSQSFKFTAIAGSDKNVVKNGLGTKYNTISGTINFKKDIFVDLLPTVSYDNLYETVYKTNEQGNAMVVDGPTKIDPVDNVAATIAAAPANFTMKGTGTVTAVLTNGKPIINPSMVNTNTKDLEASAADSSKSPKTGEALL